MKILLATKNVHKIREFREMFRPIKRLDLYTLLDFPNYEPPEETGETFEENAHLKALHAARNLQMLAIADDSGLVVPALQGKPGVRSRRFASLDATDKENNRKLLDLMGSLTDLERGAYYDCVLALAKPDGTIKTVLGRCEGMIIDEERGSSGFGYDSLFMKHDYDKTFGELDESTKNRVSHRRKAFEKLLILLESLLIKENGCST